MPVITFPFTVISPGDVARPYLPTTIVNPDTAKTVDVYALIDTGADECALPASFAPVLGHDLEKGITKRINTGNGITYAFSHRTQIVVEGFSTKTVMVDYLPNLAVPLLGVQSFLGSCKLMIDYPKGMFSLEFFN
jgi:predicted aspartyl protease